MGEVKDRSGRLTVPGERLGVIEEFTPGPGTYTEEGVVYSEIVGRALIDVLNKQVSVYPLARRELVPRPGNTVIGQVDSVQSSRATVNIMKIEKREIGGFFYGVLHVSDVSPRYVENIYDACRSGDILRARVVSDKNRTYQLSTADRDLGVMYAFCTTCGGMLELKGRILGCRRCRKTESRKIAEDYGVGTL